MKMRSQCARIQVSFRYTIGMERFIIGCGYLGQYVAREWLARGYSVAGLTRARADVLSAAGVTPILGDVLEPAQWVQQIRPRVIVYAVGWDRNSGYSFRDLHLNGVRRVLESCPSPEKFIYISSTSVHGQTDGSWIDETSATEPLEENGKSILEAEQAVRAYVPSSIILRFAGIYGPTRMIRQSAIIAGQPLLLDPEKCINLIHVEDGARAVLAAEDLAQPGSTFLVADGHPVARGDFYRHMAQLLGAPEVRFQPVPSSGADHANRKISNRKLLSELNLRLRYPDYRSGLTASL